MIYSSSTIDFKMNVPRGAFKYSTEHLEELVFVCFTVRCEKGCPLGGNKCSKNLKIMEFSFKNTS